MLAPGASSTSTPISRVSSPITAQASCTNVVFHEAARHEPIGKAVVWKVADVPLRVQSIRNPAGPSLRITCGMPSLGIARVAPAAPGTRS